MSKSNKDQQEQELSGLILSGLMYLLDEYTTKLADKTQQRSDQWKAYMRKPLWDLARYASQMIEHGVKESSVDRFALILRWAEFESLLVDLLPEPKETNNG